MERGVNVFSEPDSRERLLFPEKVELVIMDLQYDYENEHEKATSKLALSVERLPNFELLLTAHGISAGIAA